MRSTVGKRVLGLAATVRGPSQRGLATVSFGQFGQPAAVLQSSPAAPASAPSSGEVTVKISVCPVTGEDVRAVRGLSLLRSRTGVAGSTAVGAVAAVGAGVAGVATADKVLVVSPHGVWTDDVTVPRAAVVKLPASLSDDEAAALPALVSAYGMLTQYVTLKAGDVVVQTDADGPVGAAVAALGKAMGVTVVGASPADIDDAKFAARTTDKGAVTLALCGTTARAASRALQRCLGTGGALVMYQARAVDVDDGVNVPVSAAIFKKNSVAGFSLHGWAAVDPAAVQASVDAVAALLAAKTLAVPSKTQTFPQADFLKAVAAAEAGAAVALKL